MKQSSKTLQKLAWGEKHMGFQSLSSKNMTNFEECFTLGNFIEHTPLIFLKSEFG